MIASAIQPSNRITGVAVRDHWIDPTEAELWVTVFPERQTPRTEVHGRLMGPRCLYAATVEVAYPLRPFARLPKGLPGLPRRVVIPEANLWEPATPFLYQGPVELWEDGQLCDRVQIRHGLRSLGLGPRGLRLNTHRFQVRGMSQDQLRVEEARQLHQTGCNTLVAPVRPDTADVWKIGDEVGFLVIGRVDGSEQSIKQAEAIRGQPSCLGWLLDADHLDRERLEKVAAALNEGRPGHLVGVNLRRPWTGPLPANIHFLFCEPGLLPALEMIPVPKIARLDHQSGGQVGNEMPVVPGVLGWVTDA